MNNLIDNRQIRIFISSTFGDMQKERDYLFDNVFPKIRKMAEQRDVKFVEIDLRWGITYDESGSGKVMQICFDEVERCKPYFIGILGDRYGWCPDLKELEKNPDIDAVYPWVKEYISQGKSITDMEMQLGALCQELQNGQDVYASFYIKKDTDSTNEPQRVLKNIVRSNLSVPHHDYASVKELGDIVEKELLVLLDKLYPLEQCSPFEIEARAHKATLNWTSFGKLPKQSVINKLDDFLHSDRRYCVIDGQENCGKTSILSYWLKNFLSNQDNPEKVRNGQVHTQDSEYKVFYYFVGRAEPSTCDAYCSYTKRSMVKELSIPEDDPILNYDFARFCYNACKLSKQNGKKVLFVIDGVDQFEDSYIHPSSYLPLVPEGCKVIISARTQAVKTTDCAMVEDPELVLWEKPELINEDYCNLSKRLRMRTNDTEDEDTDGLEQYRRYSIHVPLLNKQDIKRNTEHYFRQFGKKLTPSQITRISEDVKSRSPYTLSVLNQYLKPLHDPDVLDSVINQYCSINNEEAFYHFILDELEQKYGRENVMNYLGTIEVSPHGIPEFELRNICRLDQVEFSPVHFAMELFVKNISGYLKISNRIVSELIEKRYSVKELTEIQNHIVDYFLCKGQYKHNKNKVIDKNSKLYLRDLPHHCEKLHRYEDLYQVITEPEVSLYQLSDSLSWSIGSWEYQVGYVAYYWNALNTSFSNKEFSLEVYFDNPQSYLDLSPMALCYMCMVAYVCQGDSMAHKYLLKSLEIYKSLGDKYLEQVMFTQLMLSQLYSENQQEEKRRETLLEAFELCSQLIDKTEVDYSNYLINIIEDLSSIYEEDEEFEKDDGQENQEKYNLLKKAFEVYLKVKERKEYVVGFRSVLTSLRTMQMKSSNWEDALRVSQIAVGLSKAYAGTTVSGYYISQTNYAFDLYFHARILNQMKLNEEALSSAILSDEIYDQHSNTDTERNMRKHVVALITKIKEELEGK